MEKGGIGPFPQKRNSKWGSSEGHQGQELRQRGPCNIPSSAGTGGSLDMEGDASTEWGNGAPTPGVGAAAQCSNLHDPSDGKSPPFGMKSNLIPSCPQQGSIRNTNQEPLRKWVSRRSGWGPKRRLMELRRVGPESNSSENPKHSPVEETCRR